MLSEIGFIALVVALLVAIYSAAISVWGARQKNDALVLSGRNAALTSVALVILSTLALWMSIINQDYQNAYVWSVSNPAMSDFFRVSALWGSQAGSLLFWSGIMAVFAGASILLNWRSHRRLMPYAIAYMMGIMIFFLFLSVVFENPFERWWVMPDLPANEQVVSQVFQPAGGVAPLSERLGESAQGLNPLLRHFGMAIHPPMLYLGFVGFMIPFAYAMSALASGDLSTNWIKASRRWALVAWLFLSLGLILGGRWAYDVLGWGGYWGWDPVENAAFLPWLLGTAFIHSVMIQEKRGMMKTWNMFLIIGTFSAVIFGTFATRSGLVESVHSFARSEIGFPMFFFWFTLTLISVGLIMHRRRQGYLRDEHRFKSLLSRESFFVLNNLVFVALFIAVFWGSFGAPIVSELFMSTNITLGIDYFMQVTPPLFLILFILMGVAPLAAWGTTSLKRLGRSLLVPAILTVISVVALVVLNDMVHPVAILGYSVVILSGWVAIYETYRGYRARQSIHKENPLQTIRTLFGRNPRRYGGYMIHLGVTIIGLGIIGSTLFQMETQQTLRQGETLTIGDYEMRYDAFQGQQIAEDGRIMDIANVTILRDGNEIAQLRPRRDFFPTGSAGMETMTIAGAHSTLENDFYVLLVGWEEISYASVTFKVYINPLINLIWWGSFILIAGTFFSAFPKEVIPARTRRKLQEASLSGMQLEGA
jgi:cytochrome c-type biogenesis protein CcmF